VVAIEPQP